jgi:hypothetical protein
MRIDLPMGRNRKKNKDERLNLTFSPGFAAEAKEWAYKLDKASLSKWVEELLLNEIARYGAQQGATKGKHAEEVTDDEVLAAAKGKLKREPARKRFCTRSCQGRSRTTCCAQTFPR